MIERSLFWFHLILSYTWTTMLVSGISDYDHVLGSRQAIGGSEGSLPA